MLSPAAARSDPPERRGFTLVEVLLVLALMALVAALLVPVAGSMLQDPGADNPDELIAAVLQDVRRTAVLSGQPVSLRYDGRSRRFIWGGAGADAPSGQRETAGLRQVDILPVESGGSMLIRGQLIETDRRAAMDFFPDGTCTPARLRLTPEAGTARIVLVDRWTCAPGLEVKP